MTPSVAKGTNELTDFLCFNNSGVVVLSLNLLALTHPDELGGKAR